MSKIAPCLWFDNSQAEEAAKFYTSIFPNSRIDNIARSPADNPSTPAGAILTADFTLDGQKFIGLNGGPEFPFTEAVSFSIDCEDQAEVDRYWEALVEGGGSHDQCGWLKDRFGVSWQVVPRQLNEFLQGPDHDGAARAMEAMLKMSKLDVERLRDAYEGVPA
jgi:predicted 3-demethylubiquinone-9 3-methyltransferase (glyoxalase superfamily)